MMLSFFYSVSALGGEDRLNNKKALLSPLFDNVVPHILQDHSGQCFFKELFSGAFASFFTSKRPKFT